MTDSTAANPFHTKFNAPDADVVLVSSDHVKFKVHKKHLSYNSPVFGDMFELAQPKSEVAEIPVAEAGGVEVVLAYCYPGKKASFDVTQPEVKEVICGFDKYDIGRGLEAVAAACDAYTLRKPTDASAVAQYFWFAARFSPDDLNQAVMRVINSQLPWAQLSAAFDAVAANDVFVAEPLLELQALLETRATIAAQKRSSTLLDALSGHLGFYKVCCAETVNGRWSAEQVYAVTQRALKILAASAAFTTTEGIAQLRKKNASTSHEPEIVPWRELEEIYSDLPTKLE